MGSLLTSGLASPAAAGLWTFVCCFVAEMLLCGFSAVKQAVGWVPDVIILISDVSGAFWCVLLCSDVAHYVLELLRQLLLLGYHCHCWILPLAWF